MQTITPEHMLTLSIGVFMDSEEVSSLLLPCLTDSTTTRDWLQQEHTSRTLDKICRSAAWLETLAEQLREIKTNLAEKALTAELRLSEGDPRFPHTTCSDMEDCLVSAYGIRPSPKDIGAAYFAVLIRATDPKDHNNVISAALVDFRPFPDNEFATRMEAVDRGWQRRHVARELFKFIESSARFLMMADGFVRINMADLDSASATKMAIKSYVDDDAPEWHTEMMHGFGFKEAEDDDCWREDIEFFKTIQY